MTHKAEREQWILDWLKQHYCADAVNQDFHEAYHQRFPEYVRRETYWGAQPVAQAQRDLARMAQAGVLERGPVSLGANWQPGFPKWVCSYSLPRNHVCIDINNNPTGQPCDACRRESEGPYVKDETYELNRADLEDGE